MQQCIFKTNKKLSFAEKPRDTLYHLAKPLRVEVTKSLCHATEIVAIHFVLNFLLVFVFYPYLQ